MGRLTKWFFILFGLWVVLNAVAVAISLRQYDPWRAITTEVREDQ